ncbi:MAG: hypothetical protein JO244_11635 [Solirubrobacterales bacterium]|nr:hypothetical protein [Solirubrobacterales bacterium]
MSAIFRRRAATTTAGTQAATGPDPELLALRDRLTERFAVLQSELGGLFYEMAIRDHVRMDVLLPKAAALQRLDGELGQVEQLLREPGAAIGGTCPSCGATHARGAAFCSQCAHQLSPG